MYTRLFGTVATAVDMAGSVSAAEMGCDLLSAGPLAHGSSTGFPHPAIASLQGISNGLVDPPGTLVSGMD
jgi:hypothetical protein